MKRLLALSGGLGILFLALGVPFSRAQQPAPLPSGPLLKRMPANSAMQITYSYAQDQTMSAASNQSPGPQSPKPAPSLFPTTPIRQLSLIHTNPFWRLIRLDTYGNSMEEWYNGRDYFYDAAGISQPIVNNPATGQTYAQGLPNFIRSDFPDLDWIAAPAYSGIDSAEGEKCMVFKSGDMTAWIGLESRLPVKWQRGSETRIFKQLPPPAQPLVLPPKMAALSAALDRDRRKWGLLPGGTQ